MLWRALMAFLPLAILVVIPVALRPHQADDGPKPAVTLVIVSPHNQAIREEFEKGFVAYWARQTGQRVELDWRAIGGTSDIVRFINDQYQIAFKRHYTAQQGADAWTAEVAKGFNDGWVNPTDPKVPEPVRQARQAFLDSAVGIGVDLFFGGGEYDMRQQAEKGHGVDAGLLQKRPEWFTEEVIPRQLSGETYYDAKGRYYGTCLTAFGIVYSKERVASLPDPTPPRRWWDLGEPRFFNQTAIADPTKSGSINKCFEMLVQEQLASALARQKALPDWPSEPDAAKAATAAALGTGWAEAMNLIKRIGGNARYFTDSASKVPHDVGRGDTTVGMCIDFYGRAEADWSGHQSGGEERVVYATPEAGSSISADPIMLLRGAPEREVAVAFMEFVLSEEGQKLWNYRVGTPGGPERYALRRLPIRRDLYTPAHRQYMADPTAEPFEEAARFTYQGAWTGPYFGLLRTLIRTMVLDPAPELRDAWRAILDAGGPEAVPEAMAEFNRLPFTFAEARDARGRLDPQNPEGGQLAALRTQREWSDFFRARYHAAATLARQGR